MGIICVHESSLSKSEDPKTPITLRPEEIDQQGVYMLSLVRLTSWDFGAVPPSRVSKSYVALCHGTHSVLSILISTSGNYIT